MVHGHSITTAKSHVVMISLAAIYSVSLFGAETLHGEDFPLTVEEGNLRLERNGVGLCEWGILEINVYRAALWLEVCCSDGPKILEADAGKRIDLVFCRKLSRKQMQKAYRTSIELNATPEELEQLGNVLDEFITWLEEAPKGSGLSIVHVPGNGVEFRQGDRTLRAKEDDRLARLMFRLYLGSKPPTRQLRDQLLGNHPLPQSLKAAPPLGEKPPEGEKAIPPKLGGCRNEFSDSLLNQRARFGEFSPLAPLFPSASQAMDLSLSIAETPQSAVTTDSIDCWGDPNRDL